MLAALDRQVLAKAPLRFETQNYLIRSVTTEDVSDEWCNWLSDPVTADLLNAQCRVLTRREIETYISSFDNLDRIILGIFHRASARLIGVTTILASRTGEDALINLLIGDEGFRAIGSIMEMREVRTAVANYIFFDRGFRSMFASVVAQNKQVIAFLRLTGWDVIQQTSSKPSQSGKVADLVLFRLSKESYVQREGQSWTSHKSVR